MPYAGIQNDEALAANPLYRIGDAIYHEQVFHREVAVMIMTYLGALKTWLYVPVFRLFGPSYISIRVPAIFFGAIGVGLCFLLLEKIASRAAAWIGTILLASDAMFLLTSCFDWGPVALQHLLSLLGLLLAVHFHQRHQKRFLAAAGFCFGLALWDKALFLWLFGGLVVATLLVYPHILWRHLRAFRRAAALILTATLFFALGASPLIVYNVTQNYPTFHATNGFTLQELYGKSFVLRGTLEGAGLFGYLVNEDTAPQPRQPSNALERAAFQIHEFAGTHRRNHLIWALLIVLISLPFLRRDRAFRIILFCAIAAAIGWFQMAITKEAGAAVHHVVLLWPLPHLMIAAAFGFIANRGKWGRIAAGLATAWLLCTNLLVLNQYLYQFARNGAAGSWSDAMFGLSADLKKSDATYLAIYDWGILNPLDLLSKGRLPLYWSDEPFRPAANGAVPPPPPGVLLDSPNVVWIGHTAGNEQFRGVNAGVDAYCARSGYRKVVVRLYPDRNGRPIFQSFRLEKVVRSASTPTQSGAVETLR
jgi:4-amino-4-deoxy-L-arabinose transferase-like glycosyltransferase